MKSTIWKTTFREIRKSFGRYFAILAIVALGVSFFAGLKVTQPAMMATTQKYLEEQKLFDYHLLSTVGFDEENIGVFRRMEGVEAAAGAVSMDILCVSPSGNEMVVKAHSLTEGVNGVVLTAGRMPEAPDECVVDSALFSKEQIGRKLVLSENNTEEDLEEFAASEYEIVGLVQSSYYIQFERGNSSLGNGRISGFVYLLPDGFTADYYTEAFVKFEEEFPLYSEAYDDYLREREDDWETLLEGEALDRYDRVLSDAQSELSDAKEELAEGRAEGEQELSDAQSELLDAEKELADAEKKIREGEKELADGRKELADSEQELLDGEERIAGEEQRLTEGEQELSESIETWNQENDKVESAKAQLQAGEEQLAPKKEELSMAEAQLAVGEAQLAAKEQELLKQEEALSGKEQELAEKLAQLEEQEAYWREQNGGELPEPYASIIAAGRQQVESGREQISQYRALLEPLKAQLAEGRKTLSENAAKLEAGKTELAAYEAQFAAGRAQLADADRQLGDAWMQILAAKEELADGKTALEEGKQELADGWIQLEEGKQELAAAEQELADGREELLEGKAEYAEGLLEYEDGVREFEQEISDAEQKIADAEEELADLSEPDTYLLDRNTNIGYVCFESDSAIVDGIANIFPVFFFAVAALVCITTMNRMVEEQRTQIGVLKALGYREGIIMGKYLFYSGSAALIGCLLGYFGGTFLFPRVIWTAYGMMYRVDSLVYVFDPGLFLLSLAVSMACSIGATWLSCRYELSEVAAELMRPKAPKAGKRVLLERIPFIWNRMKFLHKVSYRNIFRYKKRFLMMVIGISGCTALLATGFGIQDSIADVAAHQFERIQIYDISVTFKEGVTEDARQALKEALDGQEEGVYYVLERSLDLVAGEKQKAVNLIAADAKEDISPFLSLHTSRGEALTYPETAECIVTESLAEEYGIAVGDQVVLKDENQDTMSLTVTGASENYIYNYVYMDMETYQNMLDAEASPKTAYINVTEGADLHRLSAVLMKLSQVASVTVNADTRERFDSMMESLNLIVLVVILCAAGLAFIVLYNLTNINITERIREIATIKVLGFYKKETAAYVFRENLVLTLFGAVTGLFLGKLLHLFVMSQIKIDMVSFAVQIKPLSYLLSVALTFAFAWGVNFFMNGKLENISMTESLKSVD